MNRLEIGEFGRKILSGNWSINKDLTIDSDHDVLLSNETDYWYGKQLPIQFGTAYKKFICYSHTLTSFKGFPRRVGENLVVGTAHQYKSFDDITPHIDNNLMILFKKKGSSLCGLQDHIKFIGNRFCCDFENVSEGGLGLLEINSKFSLMQTDGKDLPQPFVIIQKYMGTDNIIECQSELIEAGYEEYAQL